MNTFKHVLDETTDDDDTSAEKISIVSKLFVHDKNG